MKHPKWGYTRQGDRRHVMPGQDASTALCGPRLIDRIRLKHLPEWVPCAHCITRATMIVICEHCDKRVADKGYIEDPFAAEIHDEHKQSWFCSDCYDDRVYEI